MSELIHKLIFFHFYMSIKVNMLNFLGLVKIYEVVYYTILYFECIKIDNDFLYEAFTNIINTQF